MSEYTAETTEHLPDGTIEVLPLYVVIPAWNSEDAAMFSEMHPLFSWVVSDPDVRRAIAALADEEKGEF